MYVVNEESVARTGAPVPAHREPPPAPDAEPEERPAELKADADDRTLEEAGYGYGV